MMEKISDFVKGNDNKIVIGQFEIRELGDGSYFMEHESGEGTQISRDSLEAAISQLYSDTF